MEVSHEDTLEVKIVKLVKLINDYENFQMKSAKLLQDMFTRFMDIVIKAYDLEMEFGKGTDSQISSLPNI